jgi:DNA-binding HxlR family transcriptional regulator
VGERWTLVIIQELLHAPRRYNELRTLLPGIGSNVIAERLRTLETHGIVERAVGAVGEGVVYQLTDRGRALGPALAMFRQWGLDEMLPPGGVGLPRTHNVAYAVPGDLDLHESYLWTIDREHYHLRIDGHQLTVAHEAPRDPAVTLVTTRSFLHAWVAGEHTWDSGRRAKAAKVTATPGAWDRMLLATGYPGRRPETADIVRAQRSSP